MSWTNIKKEMRLLASNEGVWADTYRWVDAEGRPLDEHRCTMLNAFPDEPPYAYHQTNMYTWPDGRSEIREFRVRYVEGSGQLAIWQDDMAGWVKEPVGRDGDDENLTLLLKWARLKAGPQDGGIYYEMINLSQCGRYRNRVWQHMQNGRIVRRCLINGEKVSDDWRAYRKGNPDWDYPATLPV